jgi:nucleotide-binding universal stress UspA family protein
MKYHDLLVVGRDSHFFYNEPRIETKTLAKVVKSGVSPTLVVTENYRDIKKVLVGFDGSIASARSLKSFVQLISHNEEIEFELMHVTDEENIAKQDHLESVLDFAGNYLLEYGFTSLVKNEYKNGSPGDLIIKRQKEIDADLIILGAHSVSAIRRLTFGSTTHDLIANTNIPLFLNP